MGNLYANKQAAERFLDHSRTGILVSILIVLGASFIYLLPPLLTSLRLPAPDASTVELLAFLSIPLALLIILGMWILKGGKPTELGLARPRSWSRTILIAILVVAVIKAVAFLLGYIFEATGLQPPDLSTHETTHQDLNRLILLLTISWTTAGFGEELIWRGFLIGRVSRLFSESRTGWLIGLLSSSLLFALLHAYQDVPGMISTGIVGLILGSAYLIFNRNLWISIIAHGLTNSISFILLYLGISY